MRRQTKLDNSEIKPISENAICKDVTVRLPRVALWSEVKLHCLFSSVLFCVKHPIIPFVLIKRRYTNGFGKFEDRILVYCCLLMHIYLYKSDVWNKPCFQGSLTSDCWHRSGSKIRTGAIGICESIIWSVTKLQWTCCEQK